MKVGDLVRLRQSITNDGTWKCGILYRIETIRDYDCNYKQYWVFWNDGSRAWIERKESEVLSEGR